MEIAKDVFLLDGFPAYAINVYVLGDVLIDSGTRMARGRILRQLKGRTITTHALTHAHPDHQGSSKAVCEALSIPLWCGEGDRRAMETGDYSKTTPKGRGSKFPNNLMNGPTFPVEKTIGEGDTVGGFTVIETPGHSPGHVSFWRESDETLIAGDVVFGMNILTTKMGLHEPPKIFTLDPALNRDSARKLAALKPKLICFGHGKPLTDGDAFLRFVDGLA